MIKEKEILKIKNKIINNYTKEEMAEALICYCNMIFNLIDDFKENEYDHEKTFKKYELKAYEETGLKIKYS